MLTSLSISDWLRLVAALVLFVGPGMALLSFYTNHQKLATTWQATFAILFAVAAWPVFMAWLQLFDISLSRPALVVCLAIGWLIAAIHLRPRLRLAPSLPAPERVILWLAVVVGAGAAVYALRSVVVGPGSDSYHHTLITQLIVERGQLPRNYLPYAPLLSFTYHYGFHSVAAAIAEIARVPVHIVVPLVAQLLIGLAALAVAAFTEIVTRNRLAAAVSAVLVGSVAVFPAYLINYGRYTQLTGTVLLAGLLALVWDWEATGWRWQRLPFVGLVAAGIALTHYRVTLMAASGVVIIFGVGLLWRRAPWGMWKMLAVRGVALAGLAFVLVAPWLGHVLSQRNIGYSLAVSDPGPSFFSLDRFGPVVLNYPTNTLLMVLLGLALVAVLLFRDRPSLLVVAWAGFMLAASLPLFAGTFMDTVSVVISLFLPVAFVIGAATGRLLDRAGRASRVLRVLTLVALLALILTGAPRSAAIADPNGTFVQGGDVAAAAWIRANTPESARFMVNTYHWDFMRDFIIGIDAGYWLPLLANRQTVTMPMTFSIERGATPDLLPQLIALDSLNGQLTTPAAVAALRSAGITHVFVGAKGGNIDVQALLTSPEFEQLYSDAGSYVFRLR